MIKILDGEHQGEPCTDCGGETVVFACQMCGGPGCDLCSNLGSGEFCLDCNEADVVTLRELNRRIEESRAYVVAWDELHAKMAAQGLDDAALWPMLLRSTAMSAIVNGTDFRTFVEKAGKFYRETKRELAELHAERAENT